MEFCKDVKVRFNNQKFHRNLVYILLKYINNNYNLKLILNKKAKML